MEKNEHIIFQDIPSRGKNGIFHSAILTTYAIDLIHLDTKIRSILHRKHICSINVFADKRQIDKTLKYVDPFHLQHMGLDYCVTNITSKGAFHPKISFFSGDEAALVLIGSGNLTVAGHGKNHELFTGFMACREDKAQEPLLKECWQYLRSFALQGSDYDIRRIFKEIPENCNILEDGYEVTPHALHKIREDLESALLYNEDTGGILSQMSGLITMKDVVKITVASPYFDEDGEALRLIMSMCPNATMDVLIQESCAIAPYKMAQGSRIKFYNFDETERGKVKISSSYQRLAHAKAFIFKTKNREYCIIGSANATIAALGTTQHRGVNDEFCVLYSSPTIDFLDSLGLNIPSRSTIEISELNRHKQNEDPDDSPEYRLLSANYDNGALEIKFENEIIPENSSLIIEGLPEIIRHNDYKIAGNSITLKIELPKATLLCHLEEETGKDISNMVFVNHISELNSTNPSLTTREFNKIISSIEDEGYRGFELVDMLNDIIWNLADNEPANRMAAGNVSQPEAKIKEKSLPSIAYNPEYDNGMPHLLRHAGTDRVSRLIECVENSIQTKLNLMEDEMRDEEEEGDSETGNKRTYSSEKTITIDIGNFSQYSTKISELLIKYQRLAHRRINVCSKSGEFVSKEDFSFFALTMFAAVEVCYLNRFMYDFGTSDSLSKSGFQKKFLDSLDCIMESDGIKALTSFADLCARNIDKNPHDCDYIKKGHRALKYAMLFATGVCRYSHIPENVKIPMQKLITALGMPDIEKMQEEFKPLIENYNHTLEFRYIEATLKTLGYNWSEMKVPILRNFD